MEPALLWGIRYLVVFRWPPIDYGLGLPRQETRRPAPFEGDHDLRYYTLACPEPPGHYVVLVAGAGWHATYRVHVFGHQ